jgi:hypothetical protein
MDLSIIIGDWPYDDENEAANVRRVVGVDGRKKVQLRIQGGLIQWEVDGRPDGRRPYGCGSILEHCRNLLDGGRSGSPAPDGDRAFSSDMVTELVDELFEYCRRSRALFLAGDYARSLRDSVHSLEILRAVRENGPRAGLTFRYDRYRPGLLVDRARAEMLCHVRAGDMAKALRALTRGIKEVERFYADYDMQDQIGDSSERQVLVDLRRSLREKYNVPLDDQELLYALKVEQEIAVRTENYEMAARLRDKIDLVRHRIGRQV